MAALQSRSRCPSASLVAAGWHGFACTYQPRRKYSHQNDLRPVWRGASGCRPVGSAEQYISRAGNATEALLSSSWQDERVYKIPSSDMLPADKVAQAQRAAEAAHQALITAGPIAEAMQTNGFLRSVMEQYSILQKLYHKAVLPVLEQHGHLAASGFSLAYAIYCQLLHKTADKWPGDSISSAELDLLAAEVQQLPSSLTERTLAAFALQLTMLPEVFSVRVVELFRLGDIISVLGDGAIDIKAAARDVAEMFGIEGMLEMIASVAGVRTKDTIQLCAQQSLLAMCQPASTPPDAALVEEDFVWDLYQSFNLMLQVEPLITTALRLLPTSDHAAVFRLEMELNSWIEVGHSSPLCTNSTTMPAGTMPSVLIMLCLFAHFGAAMCASAFQQLKGEIPLHDWSRAQAPLTSPLSTEGLTSWLNVQHQLLCLAMGQEVPLAELSQRSNATLRATTLGNLLHFASNYVRIELARFTQRGCNTKTYTVEYRYGQWIFLEMLLEGMLEVVDRNHSCWSSAMFWIDIVQLALQEAGGRPGPAAVAAAERLVKEKHSLFLARLALRLVSMQNQTFQVHNAKGTSLLAFTPLSIDRDINTMILAGGNRKRAAEIAACLQSGRHLEDERIGVVAGRRSPALPATTGTQHSLQQEVVAMLTGRESAQHINRDLAAAGATSGSASAEPGYIDAYALWMNVGSAAQPIYGNIAAVADSVWFPAALAQWWIHEHSSSQTVAQQLLGSGALEECYVRPVGEYVSSTASAANTVVTEICRLGWSISSSSALTVVKSPLMQRAQPTPQRAYSIVWLAAAALSAGAVQEVGSPAAKALECSCRALGTKNTAMPLWRCLMLLNSFRYLEESSQHMHAKGAAWADALVTAAGPFAQMEPPLQALLQAVMKVIVQNAKHDKAMGCCLGMLDVVPLMHAEDYDLLLQMATDAGDDQALLQIWKAAASAASDLQLSGTPAFGGRRPDEAWLAERLPPLLQSIPALKQQQMPKAKAANSSDSSITAGQHEVMTTAAGAATRLLRESIVNVSCHNRKPPGGLLLDAICSVLMYVARPDTIMLAVLDLLQISPQLSKPTALVEALCTAARTSSLSGNDRVYQQVVQHAEELQLSAGDVSIIRSAALGAAAEAVGLDEPQSRKLLLQLYLDTLAAGNMAPEAATPVVHVLGSEEELANQLLQSRLPTDILVTFMKAAITIKGQHALSQLLHHAEEHDLLWELPPNMLAAAVRHSCGALVRDATVLGGMASYQLLAVMLQQGVAPDTATIERLLTTAAGTQRGWTELLTWLQQQCRTAPPGAARILLLKALRCSSRGASSGDQSWQLYQLLQQCQQQGSWPTEQQEIPADLCSNLIQQQISSPSRVMQLWHSSGVPSAAGLSHEAQQVLLSAVVAFGNHANAVQLVQQVPQQLPQLTKLWQQHNDGLAGSHVLCALQLAIQQDTREAAEAAETLLEIVQRLQAGVSNSTAVSTLQLLCRHGCVSAAQKVLTDHVLGKIPADTAAAAVVAYVSAAAPDASQHEAIRHVFALMGTADAQQYLSAAYDYLFGLQHHHPAPSAVGVLLGLMQSNMAEQQVPALLDMQQLEHLCTFVSTQQHDSPGSKGGSQQHHAAAGLPTPFQLAHQCLAGGVSLSAGVTAQLVNSLASVNPDLQPAAAAVGLGIVDQADILALGSDSLLKSTISAVGPQTTDSDHKQDLEKTSKLIAELCYQQLLVNSSGSCDFDEVISSVADWVSQLSQQAAAAALFAAWHWGNGPNGSSGVCQQAVGLLCLELYAAARSGGKPSLDSLLLDIGLAAAAAAQQWDKGLAIIHTAERALATLAAGSKRPSISTWLPLLPAALSALPVVLVHTEGVAKTADRLLQEYEEQLGAGQQQLAASATGRRRRASPAATTPYSTTNGNAGLLRLSCVNSFLQSAVCVARSSAAAGDDDTADHAAAAAALRVANTLFAKQLVQLQLPGATVTAVSSSISAGAGVTTAAPGAVLCPDAVTYSFLLQLYGLTGQYQQVADITMAALGGQLGLDSSSSDPLQEVLAGSAAAWLSAGAAGVVLCLLDGAAAVGVTHINHPGLLEQLIKAAAQAEDAEQVLADCLTGGVEVAEVFMLCETAEEAIQEVSATQAAAGAISLAAGIMLAPSGAHLPGSNVLARIQSSMQQVAQQHRVIV